MTSGYYLEWKFSYWAGLNGYYFHIREYEISQIYYYIREVPLISLLSYTHILMPGGFASELESKYNISVRSGRCYQACSAAYQLK